LRKAERSKGCRELCVRQREVIPLNNPQYPQPNQPYNPGYRQAYSALQRARDLVFSELNRAKGLYFQLLKGSTEAHAALSQKRTSPQEAIAIAAAIEYQLGEMAKAIQPFFPREEAPNQPGAGNANQTQPQQAGPVYTNQAQPPAAPVQTNSQQTA